MSQYPRKLSNYIINPVFQSRMTFYFLAIVIGLLGLMTLFVYQEISQMRALFSRIPGVSMADLHTMDSHTTGMILLITVFILAAIIAVTAFSIVISHRIAGPMHAIVLYISELRRGNYDFKRGLRPYDELRPIMDELHGLAHDLKTKKS